MTEIHAFDPDGTPSPGAQAALDGAVAGLATEAFALGAVEAIPDAAVEQRGLMSAEDKAHLDDTPTHAEVIDSTHQTLRTTYSVGDNFLGTAPQFVTRLDVLMNNVMQAFARDSRGRYYMSQGVLASDGTGGHFMVTRTDAAGRTIDSSTLIGGGHGGPWGFEEDANGDVYLWTWWNSTNSIKRWKYTPGLEVPANHASVQTLPDFFTSRAGFSWANFTLSQRLDLFGVMMRVSDGAGWHDIVQLRRMSEYRSGIDNVIAELPPIDGSANGAFQGLAVDHDHAYILRGTGGAWPQTAHMDQYRWSDGQLLGTKDLSYLAQKTAFVGPKGEPECIFPIWDDQGRMALLFGFETGRDGKNLHSIYRIAPPDFQGDTGVSASLARLHSPLRFEDIPLASGFSAVSSEERPMFARDPGGIVHLYGRVKRSSGSFVAGTAYTIGTFIHEYRPPAPIREVITGGPSTQWGRFDINYANGELTVTPISGDLGWIDLSGVNWTATWGFIA